MIEDYISIQLAFLFMLAGGIIGISIVVLLVRYTDSWVARKLAELGERGAWYRMNAMRNKVNKLREKRDIKKHLETFPIDRVVLQKEIKTAKKTDNKSSRDWWEPIEVKKDE